MTKVAAAATRLTRRAEFVAAAAGRRFHTPRMTVQGIMRTTAADIDAGMRVGFTVTKRIGNSPERNRIRRRLRAAVDLARASWPDASLDLVLIARRDAITAPFEQLVDDLRRAAPAVLTGKGASAPKGPRSNAPRGKAAGGAITRDAQRRRGKGMAPQSPSSAADVQNHTDNSP